MTNGFGHGGNSAGDQRFSFDAPAPAVVEVDVSSIGVLAGKVQKSVSRVIVGKSAEIELCWWRFYARGMCSWRMCRASVRPPSPRRLRGLWAALSDVSSSRLICCRATSRDRDLHRSRGGRGVPFSARADFRSLILADEINRAPAKAQAALLEAMEERQVTALKDEAIAQAILVLATQNPIEQEGTYPLPEAQMDRFLIKLRLGYPGESDEHLILQRFKESSPLEDLEPVVSAEEVLQAQRAVRKVHVSPAVEDYIVKVIRASRSQNLSNSAVRHALRWPYTGQRRYLRRSGVAALRPPTT